MPRGLINTAVCWELHGNLLVEFAPQANVARLGPCGGFWIGNKRYQFKMVSIKQPFDTSYLLFSADGWVLEFEIDDLVAISEDGKNIWFRDPR